MIVYEKNNKLNISFDNELDNPDIEIGKGEIKLGESEITANSVLPVPEEGDKGKVPTVQEDGSYALANAGGGSNAPLVVTFSGTTAGNNAACDKTWSELLAANKFEVRYMSRNYYYTGTYIDKRYDRNGLFTGIIFQNATTIITCNINDQNVVEIFTTTLA